MATAMAAPAAVSQRIPTPLGAMLVIVNDAGLLLCEFADRPMLPTQLRRVRRICGAEVVEGEHPHIEHTRRELGEYFLGHRTEFTIPLVLQGTPFQTRVWRELLRIPWGRTTSYEAIAAQLDSPFGARAVGRANGDNRIAIIVPCHRVINADGSLSGYGGGRHRKRWLLAHEKRGCQLALEGFGF